MAPRLSVCLIVRDEATRLPACLESVASVADEVVIVDSGSTDATAAVARAAGARVHERPFDGFGPQKQAALALCTGHWVLSLDADERVTPALAAEIREVLANDPPVDGFAIRRQLWYLGSRLRFGGTGADWVVRLVRRDRARFTPDLVHERLVVDGTTRRLRGPLEHHKYGSLADHLEAMNGYTDLIAETKRGRGVRFQPWHLLRIPAELVVRLVLKGGVLDGRAGIIWAAMASYYGFLKYAKLWPDRPAGGASDA
jgi:glycosyltransferase involved in cell wall biosynthesis